MGILSNPSTSLLTCGRNRPALSSRRRENSPVRLVTSEPRGFSSWSVREPYRDIKDREKVSNLSQDTPGKFQVVCIYICRIRPGMDGREQETMEKDKESGPEESGSEVSSWKDMDEDEKALWKAAGEGDTDRVKQLLAGGVNPNAADGRRSDTDGKVQCALVAAPVFSFQLVCNISVSFPKATRNGYHETVSALLTAGADVNAQNMVQDSPLHLAAWNGRHETVSVLLTAGADVNARGDVSDLKTDHGGDSQPMSTRAQGWVSSDP
ncbi:hypothetical protein Bbelb_284780 [Branchiostoma belcheri]|nr:hypothetical protein Bbelb_284780 [Branchiostoma belcheri]